MSTLLVGIDTIGIAMTEVLALVYLLSTREVCLPEDGKCLTRSYIKRMATAAVGITLFFMILGVIIMSIGSIDAGFYVSRIPFYLGMFIAILTAIYVARNNLVRI